MVEKNFTVINIVNDALKKEAQDIKEQRHFLNESVDWLQEESFKTIKKIEKIQNTPWIDDWENKMAAFLKRLEYLGNKGNIENRINNKLERRSKAFVIKKMLLAGKNEKTKNNENIQ